MAYRAPLDKLVCWALLELRDLRDRLDSLVELVLVVSKAWMERRGLLVVQVGLALLECLDSVVTLDHQVSVDFLV
jgi:hypothetical protein